ncbi:MAG: serine/threonine protein phosphatase PrpC [Gammaproteobacteria bacterium]|jgi:serine/threonine protein phosphatase PrpC
MSLVGKFQLAGLSDVGMQRGHNEDSIASDPHLGLAVLADGMGGYKAGEVASAIAVNMVMESIRDGVRELGRAEIDEGTGLFKETLLLEKAIANANKAIHQTSKSQPQCKGMGTTIVCVLFYDDRMTIGHVGDSRMYRQRGDHFEQITVDHSLLQELVDKGFYTPEQARDSLNKNLVTRAIGIEAEVKPEMQEDVVVPGDTFLLCSDGLSDLVTDDEIHLILNEYGDNLDETASVLIAKANENGGKDNISVILARAMKPFPISKGSWYSRLLDWFD